MRVISVERLCGKCIENGGKIQPLFYYVDGKLYSHKHKEETKQ